MSNPDVWYVVKTRSGVVYEGFLGRDIRKITDKPGGVGYEVRLPSGVVVTVPSDDVLAVAADTEVAPRLRADKELP